MKDEKEVATKVVPQTREVGDRMARVLRRPV